MENKKRFPLSLFPILQDAGWHEGRNISLSSIRLSSEYSLFYQAERILREFGGLHIGKTGKGLDAFTNDIFFDPKFGDLGYSGSSEFKEVYPLGSFHRENGVLYVDKNGIIYTFWFQTSEDLECSNLTFEELFPRLLMGIKWWTDQKGGPSPLPSGP